ncbi:MAG: hypothetical protein KJ597_06385 [Nanoarchaeota archaeon]|nr:hypothetical protein [Nanoarchaeota archaeon]MBU1623175.1 hypothetical protein [Nanoarchaeota archaeon]
MSLVSKVNSTGGWFKRKVNSGITTLSIAATMAFGASCVGGNNNDNFCETDMECNSDQICEDNSCYTTEGGDCNDDFDCLESLVCDNRVCVGDNNSNNNNERETTVSGVRIVQNHANNEGRATFHSDNETVNIYLSGNDGNIINNPTQALVTYFDGSNFECYLVDHPQLIPRFECFEHNSDHQIYDLILNTFDSIQEIIHNHYGNERSSTALNNFNTYAQGWQNLGCRERDEIETMMTGGVFIIKKSSSLLSLGVSDNSVDDAANYLRDNGLTPNTVADIHIVIPSEQGLIGTSTVWTMNFRESVNGCEGAPTCQDECGPAGTSCYSTTQREVCANTDSDPCLERTIENCGNNQHCEGEGRCVEDTVECRDECDTVGLFCFGYEIRDCYLGEEGCLEWDLVRTCGTNEYCTGGECVDETPSCEDECPDTINNLCIGDDLYDCNFFDSDPCIDRSYMQTCDDGCSDGECNEPPNCDTPSCIYVSNSSAGGCGSGECTPLVDTGWFGVCLEECNIDADCDTYAGFHCEDHPNTLNPDDRVCLLTPCVNDSSCSDGLSCLDRTEITDGGASDVAKFVGDSACYRNSCN